MAAVVTNIGHRVGRIAAAILARCFRHGRNLVEQLDLQSLPADSTDTRLAGNAAPGAAFKT